MSERPLFKQCPSCQQFSPEDSSVCLQCGYSFDSDQATDEKEEVGGLAGLSSQPPEISEGEAPKKKGGCLKKLGLGVLIILGLFIVLGVIGSLLPDDFAESTTSVHSTSTTVPTFTSTPAGSTNNEAAGQSDTRTQEKPVETPVPPTPVPPATTPTPGPIVTINNNMNVRGGPGTNYPVVGTASSGQQFPITGKNPAGDWWKISFSGKDGWVYGQLVTASNGERVKAVARIPPTPSPPTPTRTPRPLPPTATVPVPLSQVDRAPIWISLVNDYGYLEVFAQVSFKVDVYGLDVLVHGEEYCNDRILYDDEPATKLSCGILEYSHSSVSDVRVRVNEDLWSEGDRYRCERNKASSQSRSVFACERVRQ